jgi:hypothetical protein
MSARDDAGLRDAGRHADGPPDAGELDAHVGTYDAGDAGAPHCGAGYEVNEKGVCVDIDECARELDDCDNSPEACVNLHGEGYQCTCPSGYEGDGEGHDGCADLDECALGTADCGALVECKNVEGSYQCGDCPTGYSVNASGDCQDINECANENGGCDTSPLATCHNQTGAPNTCNCPSGYTGAGKGPSGCVDIDECTSENGGCDTSPMATCENRLGAPRTCACPSGYSGSGVGALGCAKNCGDGKVGSDEECDPTAPGLNTFFCSPSCTSRRLYTWCYQDPNDPLGPNPDCDANDVCGAEGLCFPRSASDTADGCPVLEGDYRQVLLGELCVLACTTLDQCPSHLAHCRDFPFPQITVGYCTAN